MIHVALLVYLESEKCWGAMRETLEVADLGDGCVRLLHSPALVDGLAAGDVVRPSAEVPVGYDLVSRAGNLAAVVLFSTPEEKSGPRGAQLVGLAERLGGWCEGGPSQFLVLTFPLAAGFAAIESALDAFVQGGEGYDWSYGNVRAPETGEPLRWWDDLSFAALTMALPRAAARPPAWPPSPRRSRRAPAAPC